MKRIGALLVISMALALAGVDAGAGGSIDADLRLVTDVPVMEGMQAGNPTWAPGDVPRLVHELSDRSR